MEAVLGGGMIFLGFCLVFAAFIFISVQIYRISSEFVFKILRYVTILIFWLLTSIAAISIGFRVETRHRTTYEKGLRSVNQIWGGYLNQIPPSLTYKTLGERTYEDKSTGQIKTQITQIDKILGFDAQIIQAKVTKNIRKKGLLIFPGYDLEMAATYTFHNSLGKTNSFAFHYPLPTGSGNVRNIQVLLDGKPYAEDSNFADGLDWTGNLAPNEKKTFTIQYKAQGTKNLSYQLGIQQIEIKNLLFTLTTDFEDYLIPENSMTPTSVSSLSNETKLEWQGENLVTGQNISLDFIISGNYGELASKLFYYSPLSLFLFVLSIILFTTSKEIRLHPMHYLFMLISFSLFYLLGSYLISYTSVIAGVIISLLVSSGILLYYTFLLQKGSSLIKIVGISTFIFQWFFSLSFFLPEHTGLLITIASIATFVILLQTTAKTDWENKF